jgi:ubiquinone/menaquinone biosynthesis C-methylase UbiE
MKNLDWDAEYKHGTHWENKPSKYMPSFMKYLKKEDKILDLGCGSGRNAFYLKKRGFDVIGTDISRVAISKAKKISKQNNLQIIFKVESAERSNFSDNYFDKIYCGQVLHSTKFDKAVLELSRILKPGGIAFIIMYQSTIYEDGSEQHPTRKRSEILSEFKKYFKVINKKITESDGEDRHGKHHHVRLILVLRKQKI